MANQSNEAWKALTTYTAPSAEISGEAEGEAYWRRKYGSYPYRRRSRWRGRYPRRSSFWRRSMYQSTMDTQPDSGDDGNDGDEESQIQTAAEFSGESEVGRGYGRGWYWRGRYPQRYSRSWPYYGSRWSGRYTPSRSWWGRRWGGYTPTVSRLVLFAQ